MQLQSFCGSEGFYGTEFAEAGGMNRHSSGALLQRKVGIYHLPLPQNQSLHMQKLGVVYG